MQDIGKYKYAINFETEVYKNVYWVPLNYLGKSRYSNEEILAISKLPITDRKNKINNLYEAVQLFQICNFKGVHDNENFCINNVLWQKHKSPLEAVITNEGCCASDTNWLSFFLEDKYDFIGGFCYNINDGNGHITSYIIQDNYYYFIDMMMCRTDSQEWLCDENGNLSELLNSEWSGFLFKCKKPIDFCFFNIERLKAKNRDIPFCFYTRETKYCTVTGGYGDDNNVTICVPNCDNPRLLYKDESENHNLLIVDLPKELI